MDQHIIGKLPDGDCTACVGDEAYLGEHDGLD